MPSIHFTVEDLASTCLRASLSPLADAVFGLGVLARGGHPAYDGWRERVGAAFDGQAGPIRPLIGPDSSVRAPDGLLPLVDPAWRAHGALDSTLRTLNLSRVQATAAILRLWRVAVAPYHHRIRAYLESDCDGRGRLAMAHGIQALLATLHPRVVWRPPVLEVPDGPAGGPDTVHLDGCGLQLTPSIFLVDRPGVLLGPAVAGRPALVFASLPDAARAAALWEGPHDNAAPLGALVGQTRAAALRELTTLHTTRQLAERLGITPACASQHTAVLRRSGLITTRRLRNTALHTLTPLGFALLDGGVSTL